MSSTEVVVNDTAIIKVAPGYRLQFEEVQDTWVLLYPEGMLKLNPSAAEILRRCDGKRNVAEVVAQLETDFSETGLHDDVTGFLSVARQQNWVVMTDV